VHRLAAHVLLPGLLFGVGCGGPSREVPAPAATESVMPARPAALDTAGFDTSRVSVAAVTHGVAVHDGATLEGDHRLVLSFRGDSIPALDVAYATGPVVQCGSGEPVAVVGDAVLRIRMSPVDAHEFDGEQAIVTVPDRHRMLDGPLVRQMTMTCDFEAQVEWAIGVARRVPFRVVTSATGEAVIELQR
jgi:hypothetical protein